LLTKMIPAQNAPMTHYRPDKRAYLLLELITERFAEVVGDARRFLVRSTYLP